jgi:hypothetical protein
MMFAKTGLYSSMMPYCASRPRRQPGLFLRPPRTVASARPRFPLGRVRPTSTYLTVPLLVAAVERSAAAAWIVPLWIPRA